MSAALAVSDAVSESRIAELLAKRARGGLLSIEVHELGLLLMVPAEASQATPHAHSHHAAAPAGAFPVGRLSVAERNRRIVAFYATPHNLRETGREFGLSHEAVRLILLKEHVTLRQHGTRTPS